MIGIARLNTEGNPTVATLKELVPIRLSQPWNEHPETGLLPTTAYLAWTLTHLWAYAEMVDHDVYHDATSDNQRMWELGDVFEVFYRHPGDQGYHEVHVTPKSHRMHLHFPSDRTIQRIRSGDDNHSRYFAETRDLVAEARITDTGWTALLGIPRVNSVGDQIMLSLCRYDAHPNGAPTFSTSSPHTVADFHRPQDWPIYELLAS